MNGEDEAYPDVRESLLLQALQRTDANAYNPFGYTFKVQNGAVVTDQPYKNPAAVVDSFAAVFGRNAESSIASGDLRFTGRVLRWWGAISMASLGGEYRKDKTRRPPASVQRRESRELRARHHRQMTSSSIRRAPMCWVIAM